MLTHKEISIKIYTYTHRVFLSCLKEAEEETVSLQEDLN